MHDASLYALISCNCIHCNGDSVTSSQCAFEVPAGPAISRYGMHEVFRILSSVLNSKKHLLSSVLNSKKHLLSSVLNSKTHLLSSVLRSKQQQQSSPFIGADIASSWPQVQTKRAGGRQGFCNFFVCRFLCISFHLS